MNTILVFDKIFNLTIYQDRSLSLKDKTKWGIKLYNIFLMVLLNTWTISFVSRFLNAVSHEKLLITFPVRSVCALPQCKMSRSNGGNSKFWDWILHILIAGYS